MSYKIDFSLTFLFVKVLQFIPLYYESKAPATQDVAG